MFEGTDIRDRNVRKLRSKLGLVAQEPQLFPGSIEYNIRLGASQQKVTHNQMQIVAKQCGLHEFILSLPEGYNTECGLNSGSKLSGGQQQKLALVRALITDPEIFLLDEPTSALDARSECQIQNALQEAARGRTAIVVTQRLASIKHVDKILVFDRGRIVEQGTHMELMQNSRLYATMANAQGLV